MVNEHAEPPESLWLSPPMDTPNPRRVISALTASWIGIGDLMEKGPILDFSPSHTIGSNLDSTLGFDFGPVPNLDPGPGSRLYFPSRFKFRYRSLFQRREILLTSISFRSQTHPRGPPVHPYTFYFSRSRINHLINAERRKSGVGSGGPTPQFFSAHKNGRFVVLPSRRGRYLCRALAGRRRLFAIQPFTLYVKRAIRPFFRSLTVATLFVVVTHAPANEAELQLYRVMQRASLLNYYDTLLEMGNHTVPHTNHKLYQRTAKQVKGSGRLGCPLFLFFGPIGPLVKWSRGDDVQQLCDAGEEEFLEIMALVGMASKPLHVRRLQKALQEWVSNPALFQIPIVPSLCSTETSFVPCGQRLLGAGTVLPRTIVSPDNGRPAYSPSPGAPENSCGSTTSAPNVSPGRNQTPPVSFTKIVLPASPAAPTPASVPARSFSPQAAPTSSGSSPSSATSPIQLTPVLLDVQVQKLASAAEKLSKHLPQLEPKPQNTKKKMCKDLELVMMMPESDPKRMEEIRKYAAIYGRFDCKRKPEKPLTLHEVMVNEAAAQMCRCVPALLTRRDELFPLARQVVRRAGLHYSKHGLPSGGGAGACGDGSDGEEAPRKRPRQVPPTAHVDLTD
ncbi:NGFI-A-binding protein homolog [Eumeta japonica]|uniref:NGFI-A-binding protein homolog n=1 Tax=Eumeta variegata TaxID=151549 RepID=A0A4C1TDA6_EUMVA|nr:NGFI-A-binding protein homolog [Eumeta japonica]